jgi:hypothetical protein
MSRSAERRRPSVEAVGRSGGPGSKALSSRCFAAGCPASERIWLSGERARLAASRLKKHSGCRTIKEPRRRTGQRRDVSRALGEVRTDRAVAIPPSEPAAIHLKNGRKLSSLWGPDQKYNSRCLSQLMQTRDFDTESAKIGSQLKPRSQR